MNVLSTVFRDIKGCLSRKSLMGKALAGLFCLMPTLQVQAGNTITGSFELTVSRGDKTEVSSGDFFYSQNELLKMNVRSPEEQWMFFEGDTLLIYYPNSNSGLKIVSIQGETTLPVFQLAINASTEDAGLVAAGYELATTSVSGDSVTAVWAPPRLARTVLGDLTAVYIQDSLTSIVAKNSGGDTVLVQSYSEWVVCKGMLFPCRVSSTNSTSETKVTESIVFENVVLGSELPPEAEALAIPLDANIVTLDL